MFSIMRTLSPLFVLAGLAACGQHGASTPTPHASRVGIYHFTEHPLQSNQSFEGRVGVTKDTIVIESDLAPCIYDSRSAAGSAVIYQCGPVTVSFRRSDPVATARYTVTTTVVDQQMTCVRYTTDASGHQTCAQQRSEAIERQVPVSGTLHLELTVKPD